MKNIIQTLLKRDFVFLSSYLFLLLFDGWLVDDFHVAKVNAPVHSNRRLTTQELAEERDISFESCQEISTQSLEMREVSEKLIPRLMTEDQKGYRLEVVRSSWE